MFNSKFSIFKRLDYFFLYVVVHWMLLDFYILYLLTLIEYYTGVFIIPLEIIRPDAVSLPYFFEFRWLLYCQNAYTASLFWNHPIYWLFYISIYAVRSSLHESIDNIFNCGNKEIRLLGNYIITKDGCEMTVEYSFYFTLLRFFQII